VTLALSVDPSKLKKPALFQGQGKKTLKMEEETKLFRKGHVELKVTLR
jgi:hypothetical protein